MSVLQFNEIFFHHFLFIANVYQRLLHGIIGVSTTWNG